MTGWRRLLVRGAVVAVALLVGCGDGREGTETEATVNDDAFDGVATTVDGDEVALADFADRDLVVWFWAPW
jgi:hypothetical protein